MYCLASRCLTVSIALLLPLLATQAQPQPSWQPLSTGAQALPQPIASAMDAAGTVYVLQFQPNGTRPEMARWDETQWTTLPGQPPQNAHRIAVTDAGDALYVATQSGTDRAINGNGAAVPVAFVARYDIASGQWDDLSGGLDAATGSAVRVNALDVDTAGNLIVGGRFAQATDGTTLGNIGRWNQSAGAWEALGLGVSDDVVDLDADPFGNVAVTGRFETATNGDGTTVTVRQVARYRFATGRWEVLFNGLDPGSGTPRTIATDGTNVFIGGTSLEINGSVFQIWRFNGTVWNGFGRSPDIEPNIYDLVLDGAGFLYAYGDGGFGVRSTIHQSNAGFASWSAIAVIANGFPSTLAANRLRPGRSLFMGGLFDDFFLFNGSLVSASNFALWNGAWTSPSPPFVGVSGTVRAVEEFVVPRNGDPLDLIRLIAVGGDIASVRSRPVNRIAFATTGSDWDDPGQGVTDPGGVVHTLRATLFPVSAGGGRALMVGGQFNEVTQDDGTAVPLSNVALWRFGEERWQPLGLGVSLGGVPGTGTVHALDHLPLPCRFDEEASTFIYVGGEFDTATNADGSTVAVRNVARYNLLTNRWEAVEGGTAGPVFALRLEAGQRFRLEPSDEGLEGHALFVGGQFTEALDERGVGVPGTRNLAWLTTDGQWRAIGGGPSGPVYALETLRSAWTRQTTLFQPVATVDQCRLDVVQTTLYVGGSFSSVLTDGPNLPVSNLARVLVGTTGSRWSELGLPFGQASGTPGNGTNGPVLSIEYRPEASARPGLSFFGEDSGVFSYAVTGTFTEAYDEFGQTIASPNAVLLRNYAPLYPGGDLDADPVRRGPEVFASLGGGTNGTVFDTGWTSCLVSQFNTSTWYVGGQFSEVGNGQQAPGLAKWRDYRPPPAVVITSTAADRSGGGSGGGRRAIDVALTGSNPQVSCANPGLGATAPPLARANEVLGSVAFGESVVTTADFPVGLPLVFDLTDEDGTTLTTDTLVVDTADGVAFAVTGLGDPGVYAPNPDGLDTNLGLIALQAPDRALPLGDRVLVRFVHAVTDAPAVDVVLPDGTVIADSLVFNAASAPLVLDRTTPSVELRGDADGGLVGTYDLDLADPSAVQFVVLSGFLDPAANQNGPALALQTVALPAEAPVANEDDAAARPASVRLAAAYPNPFEESTTLRIDVPTATRAEVAVYDLLGRRVAVLHDGPLVAGTYALPWHAGTLPSGVYVVQVRTPEGMDALRLTRLR